MDTGLAMTRAFHFDCTSPASCPADQAGSPQLGAASPSRALPRAGMHPMSAGGGQRPAATRDLHVRPVGRPTDLRCMVPAHGRSLEGSGHEGPLYAGIPLMPEPVIRKVAGSAHRPRARYDPRCRRDSGNGAAAARMRRRCFPCRACRLRAIHSPLAPMQQDVQSHRCNLPATAVGQPLPHHPLDCGPAATPPRQAERRQAIVDRALDEIGDHDAYLALLRQHGGQ